MLLGLHNCIILIATWFGCGWEKDKGLNREKSYYYIVTVILRAKFNERKNRIIFFENLLIKVTRIYHSLLNLRKKII